MVDNYENESNKQRNNQMSLTRVISCLPCFLSYFPEPETPNFDELKRMFETFRTKDPNKIEINYVQRSKSEDLSEWTNKVRKSKNLKYLN